MMMLLMMMMVMMMLMSFQISQKTPGSRIIIITLTRFYKLELSVRVDGDGCESK